MNWIITLPNCYSSITQAKLELQLLIKVYYDGWENESLFLQNKFFVIEHWYVCDISENFAISFGT